MCTIFVCQYSILVYAIFVCQYFILVYELSIKVKVKFCKNLKRNIFPKQGRRLCKPRKDGEASLHKKQQLKYNKINYLYYRRVQFQHSCKSGSGNVRILIILSDLDPAPETSGSELFCRIRIRIRKRPDPNYFAISGS